MEEMEEPEQQNVEDDFSSILSYLGHFEREFEGRFIGMRICAQNFSRRIMLQLLLRAKTALHY